MPFSLKFSYLPIVHRYNALNIESKLFSKIQQRGKYDRSVIFKLNEND